eukprot:scaffold312235_cov19-Tisochrysis_lutea.AAC.1
MDGECRYLYATLKDDNSLNLDMGTLAQSIAISIFSAAKSTIEIWIAYKVRKKKAIQLELRTRCERRNPYSVGLRTRCNRRNPSSFGLRTRCDRRSPSSFGLCTRWDRRDPSGFGLRSGFDIRNPSIFGLRVRCTSWLAACPVLCCCIMFGTLRNSKRQRCHLVYILSDKILKLGRITPRPHTPLFAVSRLQVSGFSFWSYVNNAILFEGAATLPFRWNAKRSSMLDRLVLGGDFYTLAHAQK